MKKLTKWWRNCQKNEDELYELNNDVVERHKNNSEEVEQDKEDQRNDQNNNNNNNNDQEDDQNINKDDTNNNNNNLRRSTRIRKPVVSYAPSTKSGPVYETNHLNTQTSERTV